MKFILISSLILAFAFPTVAPAQTFSVDQEAQIRAITQQITDLQVQLLLARIAELQAQVAELLAKQVETQEAVSQIQQNAPVFGAVQPQPLTVSFSEPVCNPDDPEKSEYKVSVTITGGEWGAGLVTQGNSMGGMYFDKETLDPHITLRTDGLNTIKLILSSGYQVKNPWETRLLPGQEFNHEVVVPTCQ